MDLLINLDSPVVRNKLKTNYSTRSPLIPCPNIPGNNEPENNPFDAAVNAVELSIQPGDPFDMVLQASMCRNKEVVKNDERKVQELDNGVKEAVLSKIRTNIKEYVSERIYSCIEKTISSTLSHSDLTKTRIDSEKHFRRSFSAGIIRPGNCNTIIEESLCNNCCRKLNSSLPSHGNYSSINPSSGSFMLDKLEPDANGITESNSFEITKKNLREEADKISKIINFDSSLDISADSEINGNGDSSKDLLDVEPPWESNDVGLSDEEDSVGLPKLKTYRRSVGGLSNPINQPAIQQSALNKYMKKRFSTDFGQPNEDEDITQIMEGFTPDQVAASSSLLEETPEKVLPEEPKIKNLNELNENKQAETNLINDMINNQSLRPKKKIGSEILRKGPMKAIVPLQKMSKNITSKLSSPFKNKTLRTSQKCKVENVTENVIKPVAASTPTKTFSPLNSSTNARTRGRDNNKMSPTGRKAIRRSSSVGVVESRRDVQSQPNTPTKVQSSAGGSKVSDKLRLLDRKSVTRPQSAPDTGKAELSIGNIKRSALKILPPKPANRTGLTSDPKATSKAKHPATVSAQDKENHVSGKK